VVNDGWYDEQAEPDLCDLCGTVLWSGSEIRGLVADSSAVHPDDPALDGERALTACSTAHMAELQEQYRRRPFENRELWAGKVSRVLEQHPQGLSRERLVEETGLNLLQIEAGVAWQNQQLRRRQ
jgi:hypothetical protein